MADPTVLGYQYKFSYCSITIMGGVAISQTNRSLQRLRRIVWSQAQQKPPTGASLGEVGGVANLMTFRARAKGTSVGAHPVQMLADVAGGLVGRTLLLLPPSLQAVKSPREGAHPVPALIKFHT